MAEIHGVLVENRTSTADIRYATSTAVVIPRPCYSSAQDGFDDALQAQAIQTGAVSPHTKHPAENASDTYAHNSQSSFPDSEDREQKESQVQIALHSALVMFSAGLYLFDLASNICVLKVYFQEVYIRGKFEGSSPGSLNHEITAFVSCLAFLVTTQIVSFVVFLLNLPPEEYPLRSACLLPLIQAYRLLKEIFRWKTGQGRHRSFTFKRSETLETDSLFAIMSALETSAQMPLQITYIALTGMRDRQWHPPRILVMSVFVSLLSGGYNAGLAIMYNASLRWGVLLNATGIAGGLYTIGSLLLRSISIAQMLLGSKVLGIDHRKVVFGSIVVWAPVFYCFGLIALGKGAKLFTYGAQLRAVIAIFYFSLGPMYPVLEGFAPKVSITAKLDTLARLLAVAVINVLLDVLILSIAARLNCGVCHYSKERIDFPDRPYLSSTLKCARFIQLTSSGAVLSVLSTLVLCYLLLWSSLQDIKVSGILEFVKMIRKASHRRSSDSLSDDQRSVSSSLREDHLSDRRMQPEMMTMKFKRFSSRIANERDEEFGRMMSDKSSSTSAECLALKDAEAFRPDKRTFPDQNLRTYEQHNLKPLYHSLTKAARCEDLVQSRELSQKMINSGNGKDSDVTVMSKTSENVAEIYTEERNPGYTPNVLEGTTTTRSTRHRAQKVDEGLSTMSNHSRTQEAEFAGCWAGRSAENLLNGETHLGDGGLLPDSSNEKLKTARGFDIFTLTTTRNEESERPEDDERFVSLYISNGRENRCDVLATLRDGRTNRTKFSRSISVGTSETFLSRVERNIVVLTSCKSWK